MRTLRISNKQGALKKNYSTIHPHENSNLTSPTMSGNEEHLSIILKCHVFPVIWYMVLTFYFFLSIIQVFSVF